MVSIGVVIQILASIITLLLPKNMPTTSLRLRWPNVILYKHTGCIYRSSPTRYHITKIIHWPYARATSLIACVFFYLEGWILDLSIILICHIFCFAFCICLCCIPRGSIYFILCLIFVQAITSSMIFRNGNSCDCFYMFINQYDFVRFVLCLIKKDVTLVR